MLLRHSGSTAQVCVAGLSYALMDRVCVDVSSTLKRSVSLSERLNEHGKKLRSLHVDLGRVQSQITVLAQILDQEFETTSTAHSDLGKQITLVRRQLRYHKMSSL